MLPPHPPHTEVAIVSPEPDRFVPDVVGLRTERGLRVALAAASLRDAEAHQDWSRVKCVILELPRVTLLPDSLTLPPEKRVILCGPPLGSADLVQLVGSGVSGYIVREDVEDHLLALLKLAASGGFGLSPNATLGARREPIESLSQREQEVLALLSKGLVYKQVAESLGLSVHTIHAHVRRIHGKLRVGSRGEAITKAGALGLINLSEYLEVDD